MSTEKWCPLMQDMCIDGWCKKMEEKKKKGPSPKCRFWIMLKGKHPQEDKFIDDWDCAVSWLPLLLTEIGRLENSTGAAVESLRNRASDMATSFQQLTHEVQAKPFVMIPAPATAVEASPQLEHKEGDKPEGGTT